LLAEQDRPTHWLRVTSDDPHRQLEIDWTNLRAACC
jgi:hypothetical protein